MGVDECEARLRAGAERNDYTEHLLCCLFAVPLMPMWALSRLSRLVLLEVKGGP